MRSGLTAVRGRFTPDHYKEKALCTACPGTAEPGTHEQISQRLTAGLPIC